MFPLWYSISVVVSNMSAASCMAISHTQCFYLIYLSNLIQPSVQFFSQVLKVALYVSKFITRTSLCHGPSIARRISTRRTSLYHSRTEQQAYILLRDPLAFFTLGGHTAPCTTTQQLQGFITGEHLLGPGTSRLLSLGE